MTNRKLAKSGQKRPHNQKDGRQQISPTKAQRQSAGDEMEAAGFTMIDWNKWTYGGFRLVPGTVDFRPGWVAICEDGRQIPIGTAPAAEIKQRLDDEMAKLTGIGPMVDIDDLMTAGLTPAESQRMGRVNTRPGAEYGVWT